MRDMRFRVDTGRSVGDTGRSGEIQGEKQVDAVERQEDSEWKIQKKYKNIYGRNRKIRKRYKEIRKDIFGRDAERYREMRSKYRVIIERNRKIPRKYKENGDRKYRGDMKRAGIDTGRSRDDTGKVKDKQKDRSDRSREDKIRFRELRGDTGWKIQGRIGDRCGNVYRQIRRRYKEIWVGRSGMREPEKSREIQGR
jgi:hypothetical protein